MGRALVGMGLRGLVAMCVVVGAVGARAAVGEDVLKTLRKGHPRLMVLDEDIARVEQAIATDATAKAWHEALRQDAEEMLGEKPVVHRLIGPRLLDQSRLALRRISTLAGMYRLDGDKRFVERARQEMLTAAAFKDWNPSHFLDVAEMTNALAIGYDWLYDQLSAEDRATIRNAIVELGLKEGAKVYEGHRWWAVAKHNWNQVCNGGMTSGALAIADEEPALAGRIIQWGRQSIPLAMASFAPDGGWAEGPGYWNYATRYNVYYLAAVETALGTDFGLKKMPGFAETDFFRIHFVGPNGKSFNYADAGEREGTAAQSMWFAREFDQPVFAAQERYLAKNRVDIFHLLWFDGREEPATTGKFPLDAVFRGVNVAFFRSAWQDPKAVFVGFKGGDNKANHSHLDLGTFVLDAQGQRWAMDLGSDEYNMPGYFGNKRWTYYRLRTEGHNTLTIDGQNQNTAGKAPLVAYHSSPERAFAVADLSEGYKANTTRVVRGIALEDRRRVVVRDEVEAKEPVEVVWNFHTPAAVRVQSGGGEPVAILSQGGEEMEVRVLSPKGARFEVLPGDPPQEGGHARRGKVSNLTVKLAEKVKEARVTVVISPVGEKVEASKEAKPLAQWIGEGKLTE